MAHHKYKVEELADGGRRFTLHNDVMLDTHWGGGQQVRIKTWRNDYQGAPDSGDLFKSRFRKDYVKDNTDELFADLRGLESDSEEERAVKVEKRKTCVAELTRDLQNIAILLTAATSGGQSMHAQMAPGQKKPDVTERLIRYGRQMATFYHTPDRQPFAAVEVADHTEHYKVTDEEFSDWLENTYWDGETDRLKSAQQSDRLQAVDSQTLLPDVVRDRDLNDAIRLLRGLALFKGEQHEVYRRVAGYEGKIYVDLVDDAWRVIEIDTEGWRVIPGDEAPVRFSRKPGMLPLPEPTAGGSLQPLRELLHLGTGEHERRNWYLIVPWLVQSLSPEGAYSILTTIGTQGSGKSDMQWVLRSLTDPNTAMLRGRPDGVRDLFISAHNGWVLSLENMDKLPPWLANALCMICTMGSWGIRANYTDDREVLFRARRPILVNGIGDILDQPDLLERATIVRLPRLEGTGKRMTDDEVFATAEEIAPGVIGALLDLLSNYLSVKDDLPKPDTRMITYARVGLACADKLSWNTDEDPEAFMSAYLKSKLDATSIVLEKYPISAVLMRFAQQWTEDDRYEGTAQELLKELNDMVGDHLRHADNWPGNASQLGTQLNAIEDDLRKVGVLTERKTIHGTVVRRVHRDASTKPE